MGAVVSAVAAIKAVLPVVQEVLGMIQKGVQTVQQVVSTVDEKLKGLPLSDNQKQSLRELASCAAKKVIDGVNIPKSHLEEVGKRFGEAFNVNATNFAEEFVQQFAAVATIDPKTLTNDGLSFSIN